MTHIRCNDWRRKLAWTVLGVLFLAPAAALADEPAGDIFAAVRGAVADGNVDKSRLLGFSITKKPFSETAREGILIGLDCGVGKFGSGETVYAFRPIYRTPTGNNWFKEFGIFADAQEGNKTVKTKVLRTVQLRAKPGYAVGGVTMRTGLNIDGLSLTYMRIVGTQLDPAQSYVSEWVGDRKGGSENRIEGTGNPVVGVFGNISDSQHVQALGLIYARGLARSTARPADPVIEPVKPVEVPVKPPDVTPRRPTEPAKVRPTTPVPATLPADAVKQIIPTVKLEPVTASSTSNAEQEMVLPYLAGGSVAVTALFVGLVFVRHGKGPTRPTSRASAPIKVELLEPPSETAPTIKLPEPGAIRAAQPPTGPAVAPKVEAPPAPAPGPPTAGSGMASGGMPLLELDDVPAKPQATAAETKPSPPPTKPLAAPGRVTFFTGRMVTKTAQPLFRVYVCSDEVLFIYAGPGEGNSAIGTGQALGGVVGGLIGKAVGAEMQERTRARQRELDKADIARLRELAARDDNFRATAADFTSMTIEAVGFWNSLSVGPDCAAVLHFTHRERGNGTLALLSLDDVRIATEELPATLGDLVKVNVVWSDASLKYVKRQ